MKRKKGEFDFVTQDSLRTWERMVTMRPSFPSLVLVLCLGLPASSAPPWEGVVLPFRQADLGAPVSSHLVELKAKEGDVVRAGQPLAQFYGHLEDLEMQRAKALLERREFEARGAKRLFENRVIPESKAVESRIELDLARLQYETATEQVRLRLLLAPFDGVIVARYRELGESVAASQPVFRLLNLSKVLVQCAVPPEDLGTLVPGQALQVRLSQLPGHPTFTGTLTLMDPCADPQGCFRVQVQVDNPEGRLRSGLKASVVPMKPSAEK